VFLSEWWSGGGGATREGWGRGGTPRIRLNDRDPDHGCGRIWIFSVGIGIRRGKTFFKLL